ncbi:MucR family transcriptional regulator [Mesorhizobium captivum]
MTADEYLQKWRLKAEHLVVTPNYAAQRSRRARRHVFDLALRA